MCIEKLTLPLSVSLEDIPYRWQQSEVLIFLVDLDDYFTFSTNYHNMVELESLKKLQTIYFKKRYILLSAGRRLIFDNFY
jgi:4'-phosphopantetheinyl transferase